MSPSDLNAIAQYLKSPLSQKWIAFRREFASSLSAGMVKREDEAKLEEETFSKEELREISELERSGVFARFNAGLRAIQEQMVRTAQVDDDAMWKDFMAWVKLTAEKEGYVK